MPSNFKHNGSQLIVIKFQGLYQVDFSIFGDTNMWYFLSKNVLLSSSEVKLRTLEKEHNFCESLKIHWPKIPKEANHYWNRAFCLFAYDIY